MPIVLVALTGLVVALGLAFWPWPRRSRPAPPARAHRPDSLEGVLTAELLSGEISGPQYVRALERIAARDERRRPLSAPRDHRP